MGQLLRDRGLGRWRADRIAVRCYDTHRRAAGTACGGGRRRICHADDRPFGHRAAFVSSSARPMAGDRSRRSSLGIYRPRWRSVRGDRSPAHASANDIPTRVRGLVVHIVLPLAAYTILAFSAFAALAHTRQALFGVGGATLLLLFVGIQQCLGQRHLPRVQVMSRSLSNFAALRSAVEVMSGRLSRSRPTSHMTILARGAWVRCLRTKKGGPVGPPLRCLVRRRTRQCLVSIRLP